MKVFYSIFITILGIMFGSFFNVVGLRLPKRESLIRPGSHCPSCNHKLKWYENIPIISYLILNGKCKVCKEPISLIYPFIEILTGITFLFSYWLFGLTENFYISIIIASLVSIIFVSDSKYYIIDDEPLIVAGIFFILVKLFFEGPTSLLQILIGGIVGFCFAYSLRIFGFIAFKKESLGGGDIKLSLLAGMILGAKLGIVYIVFACFLAFPYAIYLAIKNNDHMLPFGPFLVSSLYIIFLNHDKFMTLLNTLFGMN